MQVYGQFFRDGVYGYIRDAYSHAKHLYPSKAALLEGTYYRCEAKPFTDQTSTEYQTYVVTDSVRVVSAATLAEELDAYLDACRTTATEGTQTATSAWLPKRKGLTPQQGQLLPTPAPVLKKAPDPTNQSLLVVRVNL